MNVRNEQAVDVPAIRRVNELAFGRADEAILVDAVRASGKATVSLVATDGSEVVGHILFSPVTIEAAGGALSIVGLAPMAVLPERQRGGIGSMLVRAGLERCGALGHSAAVVLGHPEYYPRFGFAPASRFGIRSEYAAPDEAFLAIELRPGALDAAAGRARYAEEFGRLP